MTRGIDHVGLTVSDLDRSLAFWRDALGFELIDRGIEGSKAIAGLLGLDNVELEIADLDAGEGHVIELIRYLTPTGGSVHPTPPDTGSSHVAVHVGDLDTTLRKLLQAGGRPISGEAVRLDAPGTRWHGRRCFYLTDPDGVVVELIESPSSV